MANGVDSTYADQQQQKKEERRHRSIFDVQSDFFDSCRLLQSPNSSHEPFETSANETLGEEVVDDERHSAATTPSVSLRSCNTCMAEFESLQDQRSHFMSDIHRFNVKSHHSHGFILGCISSMCKFQFKKDTVVLEFD
ncbi:hypothetical protein Acr_08g0008290 [Actinidia rufa]|uniref:C2H2-type domain-containing protein n=1 Tax=Actinidia rufa TaxID=165716 RepID=A0A7J0F1E1_9ERIC|nr:hypothetical protein Acr_08g0008290 [Actinidia rufa]